MSNPVAAALSDHIRSQPIFGQLLIRPSGAGFELRHVLDEDATGLEFLPLSKLRSWVQTTATGAFRPLKSSPNLRRGWTTPVANAAELAEAVEAIYPGALADWHAVRTGRGLPTGYREFVGRQTGMYRIAAMLSDEQAARVAHACCAAHLCLKRRLWTVPGSDSDAAGEKSSIPCLEPCAVLLELARKAMRIEQEEAVSVALAPSDLATIRAALVNAAQRTVVREGDVASPENPRRALLALAKLENVAESAADAGD